MAIIDDRINDGGFLINMSINSDKATRDAIDFLWNRELALRYIVRINSSSGLPGVADSIRTGDRPGKLTTPSIIEIQK